MTDDSTHDDGQQQQPQHQQPIQMKGTSSTLIENCSHLAAMLEDSDETESALDEDPNDPEWREPPPRIPRTEPKL